MPVYTYADYYYLPFIINEGDICWFKNNKLHRDNDLPAVEYEGDQYWYKNDKQYFPTVFSININMIKILIVKMNDKWWYKIDIFHN